MTIRIRIVQAPSSSDSDGIRLDSFEVGQEYEVGNSIGALLLAEGWAEPIALDAPKPIVPFSENDPFDSRTLYRDRRQQPALKRDSSEPVERAAAADTLRFRRRPRRRRP